MIRIWRRRFVRISIMLAACSLIAACASGENRWPMGAGEVPSTVGNPDEVVHQPIPNELPGQIRPPSGKWFLHDGSGVFGYGMPSGTMKAGESFEVLLFGHASGGEPLGRDVRIRLMELNGARASAVVVDETVWIETVNDRTSVYEGHLPDKENIGYMLQVEILAETGEVEDALASLIHVPVPEIHASLRTEQTVYTQKDRTVKLLLHNAGPTRLIFGTPYRIEKKVGDIWRIVPLGEIEFTDLALLLEAGETYEETIDISDLRRGQYRIIRDYSADGLDLQVALAAEFQIES